MRIMNSCLTDDLLDCLKFKKKTRITRIAKE